MANYLVIGQGNIGKPLAIRLAKSHTVKTVARRLHEYGTLAEDIHFLQKDAKTLTLDDVKDTTHLAIIITPSNMGRASALDYQKSYLAVCQHIVDLANQSCEWQQKLKQVLFVSSTSVYGQNQGEWIDETTPALPITDTAQILKDAEDLLWQTFGKRAIIVRAGGIYHKNSTRLIEQARQAHLVGIPRHHYTNRIMDNDLVNCLYQILVSDCPKSLYLVTDNTPVTSFEVLEYIAKSMNYPSVTPIFDPPSGKRIIANIHTNWLSYPNYQIGYDTVIAHLIRS
ncbi:hypothetical protein [Moraxella catarrhalis]|uniref:hypothetical protein n=1 Tax=Moraxella catarrhalis TaxID=480 RepID=UPI0007E32826|nr:hypothetical protein [Moraxella catarrhalis]OAV15844.1 Nucleoside-diphosphate-sugar epimerase [Moraxella catarrhalis]OAV16840.1 Nucleoside-diphosphate-sugar epimerase [Moraxella catarrhalis]